MQPLGHLEIERDRRRECRDRHREIVEPPVVVRRHIGAQRHAQQRRQRLPHRHHLQGPPALSRWRDHRRGRERRRGEQPGADRQQRARADHPGEERRHRDQQRAHRQRQLPARQHPPPPDPAQQRRQHRRADRIGKRIAHHQLAGLPGGDVHIFCDRGQQPADKPALGAADKRRQGKPEKPRIHEVPRPDLTGPAHRCEGTLA